MKMPRKIPGNVRNKEVDLHYTEKRQKNNDAVKKSREKTRQKAKETMEKVTQLKQVGDLSMSPFRKKDLNQSFSFRRMKCWRRESSYWRRSWHSWRTSSWRTPVLLMASLLTTWRSRGCLRRRRWVAHTRLSTQYLFNAFLFRTWWADRNTKICIWIVTNRNSVCQSNSATGTRPCNNFPALKGLSWRSWERWKSGRAGLWRPHALPGNILKKYLLSLFPHWTKINEKPLQECFHHNSTNSRLSKFLEWLNNGSIQLNPIFPFTSG